jgi:hypothetical protein
MPDLTDLMIWADYLDEQGQDSTAVRALVARLQGVKHPFVGAVVTSYLAVGSGAGCGYGDASTGMRTTGDGSGYGASYGYGDPYGDGHGDGLMYGCPGGDGCGYGYGDVTGDGSGCGQR